MLPAEIFALFGRTVVLLRIAPRTKRPIDPAWEDLTVAEMTPAYLASLNGNIGILHGRSSGGLTGIEFDSIEAAKAWYRANPWAKKCLWSKAKRGPCFWVFIEGDYPPNHDLYDATGIRVGEWRADGRQTVFTGEHPDGIPYTNSGDPPARLRYSDIIWPPDVQPTKPTLPGHTVPVRNREAIMRAIQIRTGTWIFRITQRGAFLLNHAFAVDMIKELYDILFEQDENDAFLYNEATGAWVRKHDGAIDLLIREQFTDLAIVLNEHRLYSELKDGMLNAITEQLKSVVGRTGVFKTRQEGVIHCGNIMLHLSASGDCKEMPFNPLYYSRNPIPINYRQDAKCPRFLEFLHSALDEDDLNLVLRWFGSILLTGNSAQRVLMLVGAAESGKSTIAEIFESILGLVNVTALRTEVLHEKFELGRLFGFTLLTAKDVDGKFLNTKGAQVLKRLVGHDYTPGERKGVMHPVPVYGNYDCLITCNKRLVVRLEGQDDIDAWRRRLMMIAFTNPIPKGKRIANFAQVILAEEGEGILALGVQAAVAHLAELSVCGNFVTTPKQDSRVEELLSESEAVRHFVTNGVERVVGGDGLSTGELVGACIRYCTDHDWTPPGPKDIEIKLTELMMTIHGVHVGTHIERNNRRVRGYPHVALVETQSEDEETKEADLL
jgi:hypothetical protein